MLKKLSRSGILTHIFFVLLFLVVPTLAFARPPGESPFALTRVFVQDTIANFVLLCFFYLNYYVLLLKKNFNRKYIQYVVYVLLFLSLAFFKKEPNAQVLPDWQLKLYCGQAGSDATNDAVKNHSRYHKNYCHPPFYL